MKNIKILFYLVLLIISTYLGYLVIKKLDNDNYENKQLNSNLELLDIIRQEQQSKE